MKFTILGGTGFIGRNLANYLSENEHEVEIANRDILSLKGQSLGHVIYAIGLTGDFRSRLHDTIDAHVTLLSWILQNTSYESLLYLSSTRVYGGLSMSEPATENTSLPITPGSDSLYDISKLLGESLCLGMNNPKVRIARLSNVYGQDQSHQTFLGAVLEEVRKTGKVTIHDHPESSKDYVSIHDVTKILTKIVLHGTQSTYNVASGQPVTCQQVAKWIEAAGFNVLFSGQNNCRVFPTISTKRITEEFKHNPKRLENEIQNII